MSEAETTEDPTLSEAPVASAPAPAAKKKTKKPKPYKAAPKAPDRLEALEAKMNQVLEAMGKVLAMPVVSADQLRAVTDRLDAFETGTKAEMERVMDVVATATAHPHTPAVIETYKPKGPTPMPSDGVRAARIPEQDGLPPHPQPSQIAAQQAYAAQARSMAYWAQHGAPPPNNPGMQAMDPPPMQVTPPGQMPWPAAPNPAYGGQDGPMPTWPPPHAPFPPAATQGMPPGISGAKPAPGSGI